MPVSFVRVCLVLVMIASCGLAHALPGIPQLGTTISVGGRCEGIAVDPPYVFVLKYAEEAQGVWKCSVVARDSDDLGFLWEQSLEYPSADSAHFDIGADDGLVAISLGSDGLFLFDATSAQRVVSEYESDGRSFTAVAVEGDTVWAGSSGSTQKKLLVLDATNRDNPDLLVDSGNVDAVDDIVVRNGVAYVITATTKMHAVEYSNPDLSMRTYEPQYPYDERMFSLDVQGDHIYLGTVKRLQILDASDLSAPFCTYDWDNSGVYSVGVAGPFVYLGLHGQYDSTRVVDVSDVIAESPSCNVRARGELATPLYAKYTEMLGSRAFCVFRPTLSDSDELVVLQWPDDEEDAAQQLLDDFETLDVAEGEGEDGDGVLSFDEAQAGRPQLTEDVFEALDGDSDGLLTVAELEAALEEGEPPVEGEGPTDGEPSGEGDPGSEGQVGPVEAESGPEGEGEPGEGEPSEGDGPASEGEGLVTRDDVYVSSADGDNGNDGTISRPWRTIAYAIRQIQATSFKPITINLAPGEEYTEQVFLPKHTRLVGTKENDPSGVVIRPPVDALDKQNYAVIAEENTELKNLSIRLDVDSPPDVVLLRINDVNMTVRNVFMSGGDVAGSVGVSILKEGSSDSLVTHSWIERVDFGVRAVETNANITQNAFRNIRFDGVFIRPPDKSARKADDGTLRLGDAEDADTGYNTFENVEEKLVRNQDLNEAKAEANDWGVYRYEDIEAKMGGEVDFVPFLKEGILSASLACILVDKNEAPVDTATVQITPVAMSPVTQNTDGVYLFPALSEGAYTLKATAPGYADASQTVNLGGAEVKTITMVLEGTGGEGEAPEEGESTQPAGCFASKNARAGLPTAPDLFVAALSLLVLAWAGARRSL